MAHRSTNNLGDETSPYLLQHAHNPVHWHAWNNAAIDLARRLDKPILLSIGYSACHWCHVMEQESFEDEATAAYMNEHFVCIKVDREERPDLDKIYQLAHQMLIRRPGGWPLNVVLTPDTHAPIFAGTYFPRISRHGMPSFTHVLRQVVEYYYCHRQELPAHADAVKAAFAQAEPREQADIRDGLLDAAVRELGRVYDHDHGGFGNAPKFPHPTNIELCLLSGTRKHQVADPQPHPRRMACHTLERMGKGGLCDQLGGGFFRYSVDGEWSIPHFEKMLYDNALLLPLLVDAWLACGDAFFKDTALSTAGWVIAEMQAQAGGFYSSLDADSEGEEGKFYIWSRDQIEATLTDAEYTVARTRFGLAGSPNFEGRRHLNIEASLTSAAARACVDPERAAILLASAKEKLLAARNTRIRPALDDKVLTAWNALMITGMAHAGRILQRQEFVSSATRALDFIRQSLWQGTRLLATARGGKAHLNAYLDDYVYLIDAIMELNQSRWRTDEVNFAVSLADVVLAQFEDVEHGGFFFTSNDHEQLLHRSKPAADDATPSGNGIAARVLLRLGHLLGENRYVEAAERTMRAFAATANRYPAAHGTLVMAMEEFLSPPEIIIIRGEAEWAGDWTRPLLAEYKPHRMVYVIPPKAANLPGKLPRLECRSRAIAYICRGTACSAPIDTVEKFIHSISKGSQHA